MMRRTPKTAHESPIPVATVDCAECWAPVGQEHELSCPHVSYEAFAALMREQGRPLGRLGNEVKPEPKS